MAHPVTSDPTTSTTVPAVMPDDADRLRDELREIKERREVLTDAIQQLAQDTGDAIQRARGELSMTEIARLIGIDRTGLYRTYTSA